MADMLIPRPMVMADMSNPRPMVNCMRLRNFMGKRVTAVVKVLRVEGGNVLGELPDGAPITVHRALPRIAALSQFIEVIGVVESDRFLRAHTCTGFGDGFGIVVSGPYWSLDDERAEDGGTYDLLAKSLIEELSQRNTGTGI